jgi:ABC-type multidrug transport system ATPase subunit
MEEADKFCNRIGFINKGKIIAIDTPEQLKRRIKNDNTGKYIWDTIKLYFKAKKEEEEDNANENNFNNSNDIIVKNFRILKSFKFVKKIEQKRLDGKNYLVIILQVDDINHNLPIILKSIDNVESVEFSQPTLDDVFYTVTEGAINEVPEGGFMERYAQYDK